MNHGLHAITFSPLNLLDMVGQLKAKPTHTALPIVEPSIEFLPKSHIKHYYSIFTHCCHFFTQIYCLIVRIQNNYQEQNETI